MLPSGLAERRVIPSEVCCEVQPKTEFSAFYVYKERINCINGMEL